MTIPVVHVLLVDDNQAGKPMLIHQQDRLKQQLRRSLKSPVDLSYIQASDELSLRINRPPDLILVHLPDGKKSHLSKRAIQLAKGLRGNLRTYPQPMAYISHQLPESVTEQLDEYGVFPFLSPDLRNWRLLPNLRGLVRKIVEEQSSSSGLPGKPVSYRLLERIVELRNDHEHYLVAYTDLRHLGMAGNDLLGNQFGNTLINLGADNMLEGHQSDSAFQIMPTQWGGDEFLTFFQGNPQVTLEELLQHVAKFFDQVCKNYALGELEHYGFEYAWIISQFGYLVGPDVKDKQGRYTALSPVVPRTVLMPVYPDLYSNPNYFDYIQRRVMSKIKDRDNQIESRAQHELGLPSLEPPDLRSPEFLERHRRAGPLFKKIGCTIEIVGHDRASSYLQPLIEKSRE